MSDTTDKSLLRLNGILNVDKRSGPTSRDCVNCIQKLIRPTKVGHAGTLDPIASGVLLLLVGPAVRLTEELHELDKEYVGTFQLGVSSPSADTETEISSHDGALPSLRSVESVLPQFIGNIEQIPPIYSAIQIGGKRAHAMARAGKSIEMPSRSVQIDALEIVSFEPPMMTLRIVCGTGTYIRSLGRDIARSVGSDAVMTSLVRTRIGPFHHRDGFDVSTADSIDQIHSRIQESLVGLPRMPRLVLDANTLQRFKDGQRVALDTNIPGPVGRVAAIDSLGHLNAILSFDGIVWRTEKFLA